MTELVSSVADRIDRAVQRVTPLAYRRSEEHTSELQSLRHLVCRLLLEKKKTKHQRNFQHGPNISTPVENNLSLKKRTMCAKRTFTESKVHNITFNDRNQVKQLRASQPY